MYTHVYTHTHAQLHARTVLKAFQGFYKAFMVIKYNHTKELVSSKAPRSYGNISNKT